MDVRAPVEFAKGSFPLAINIPILDDHQRELIGTCYKEEGPEAAVTLGYRLATDDIRTQRLKAWQSFIRQQPKGYLFCFRGGQRSHITQQWLKESGYPYPLIKGGYKALRRFLIDELERSINEIPFIILSGKTGTGKTWLIQQLPYSIDLEGLANHRGLQLWPPIWWTARPDRFRKSPVHRAAEAPSQVPRNVCTAGR